MRPLKTRKLLAEDIADSVRLAILNGSFEPGERLVESRIAQQLGVSRGPLREAFKLLRAEGFVHEEPHRGTFVMVLSPADVGEIYEVRAAVEARAARLLAEKHRPADLKTLSTLFAGLEAAAINNDTKAMSEADMAFHETVCRLTRNRRLYEVFVRHVPFVQGVMKLDEHLYGCLADAAQEHKPMLEAIGSGDGAAAARLFEAHIERARDRASDYLKTEGRSPGGPVPEA
jgi:GntR family transcriptional regulator, gluconate operon transcriptional repressor